MELFRVMFTVCQDKSPRFEPTWEQFTRIKTILSFLLQQFECKKLWWKRLRNFFFPFFFNLLWILVTISLKNLGSCKTGKLKKLKGKYLDRHGNPIQKKSSVMFTQVQDNIGDYSIIIEVKVHSSLLNEYLGSTETFLLPKCRG